MNTTQPKVERVPLTEAEIEHLSPIIDRWEAAQRDFQTAQRDTEAVIKLYRAQHKNELADGPEWQLSRDCFLRQLPPTKPVAETPPPASQEDDVNGSVEEIVAEMMAR